MRADPPVELVELLERLRLATGEQVRGVYPRVKQLAGELPLFPSVWVDALAHGRVISTFQAAEINAGRSERLAVGPFVLTAPLQSLGYAHCYRAREIETRRQVELLTAAVPTDCRDDCLEQIRRLIEKLGDVASPYIQRAETAGADGDRLWIAFAPIDATPLSEVVPQTGRMPGGAVLEIARQMVAAIAKLESAGIVHGELSASAIGIDDRGSMHLTRCGVRGILRPEEGFAHADLAPEAYDYLAPERVVEGSPPSTASDLFACGCVWWHLLTGRPPLSGGTSLGKLRAAQIGQIVDVRRFAPDAPAALVAAIAACTQRDPLRRPDSFTALVAMLGPPTPAGRRAVEQAVAGNGGGKPRLAATARRAVRSRQMPAWIATIAGCLAIIAVVLWPLWRPRRDVVNARNATHNVEPKTLAMQDAKARPLTTDKSIPAGGVEQATFVDPAVESRTDQTKRPRGEFQAVANGPPPITLPGGKLIAWNQVEIVLRAGQTVRGQPRERPLIAVPPNGVIVAADDVRFENIDFVWRLSPNAAIDPERLALIDLRAARASFHGCTFQATTGERTGQPTAIRWTGPRRQGSLPPAGRLQLSGCVFRGVATAIDCRLTAPLAMKIADTLYLGPGPLVRLDHAPRPDEPIEIELTHSTLRDAAALVGLRVERLPSDEPGSIGVTTNDCVLAPSRGGALVMIAAPGSPTSLARSFQWSGQGSLLSPACRVGVWLKPGNDARSAEIEIPVDGLVSSEVEFAGPADAGSSASRVTKWTAPVQSVDPPGIPDGLPNLPSIVQIAN